MYTKVTVMLLGGGEYEYEVSNASLRDGFLIMDLKDGKRTVAYNKDDIFSYEAEQINEE